MTPKTQTIASEIAAFVEGLQAKDIPADVRSRARYLILDAVGIALASTQYDYSHRTLTALREFGGGDGDVIGYGARLALRDAVMMNAFLVHGLDFDDTHTAGVIHATASVFPAALGVAAAAGASGADMLTAYIAGMEVTTRLGSVARGGFHQTGFHPTGLIGAFGATMASSKLKNLTADQMAMAQGIALSMASGSLEFLQDGAWTKRMHPGWAGVAGITATALARNGFVGPKAVYEGRFGLFPSHLGDRMDKADLDLATAGLGNVWEVMNVAIKPLPACHFTHASADAAMTLRAEHELRAEQIESVQVLVPEEVVKTVCEPVANKQRPQNAYDAQFSIPYAVASSLLRGHFGLSDLEPEAFMAADVLELAAKVQYAPDPNSPFPKYYSGEVIVQTKDGRSLRHREEINRGSADRPLSAEEITEKFRENAATAIGSGQALKIEAAVLSLDECPDVRALSRCMAGQTGEKIC